MDGHECSEVRLCELDSTHRLDAEFYSKEYIYETHQLLKRDYFTLQSHYKVTDGEHGSVEYLNNGVAYLTAENNELPRSRAAGYRRVSPLHIIP